MKRTKTRRGKEDAECKTPTQEPLRLGGCQTAKERQPFTEKLSAGIPTSERVRQPVQWTKVATKLFLTEKV